MLLLNAGRRTLLHNRGGYVPTVPLLRRRPCITVTSSLSILNPQGREGARPLVQCGLSSRSFVTKNRDHLEAWENWIDPFVEIELQKSQEEYVDLNANLQACVARCKVHPRPIAYAQQPTWLEIQDLLFFRAGMKTASYQTGKTRVRGPIHGAIINCIHNQDYDVKYTGKGEPNFGSSCPSRHIYTSLGFHPCPAHRLGEEYAKHDLSVFKRLIKHREVLMTSIFGPSMSGLERSDTTVAQVVKEILGAVQATVDLGKPVVLHLWPALFWILASDLQSMIPRGYPLAMSKLGHYGERELENVFTMFPDTWIGVGHMNATTLLVNPRFSLDKVLPMTDSPVKRMERSTKWLRMPASSHLISEELADHFGMDKQELGKIFINNAKSFVKGLEIGQIMVPAGVTPVTERHQFIRDNYGISTFTRGH